MLDASRYLLGVAEIGLLAGSAVLGASQVRARLLPEFTGAPAHLATSVIGLTLLIWTAELLGTVGLFKPLAYLVAVAVLGAGAWAVAAPAGGAAGGGRSPAATGPAGLRRRVPAFIGLVIAAVAVIHFADGVQQRLGTGMTGFDSTWYHGPFAAGFFQSGDTWDLHFIAPQFLAWFYPANAEIFHAVGMLAFDRDVLSPLLNLGWFVGCLVAVWCIGRPFGVAPWSLALGAIALSVPALSDQAGEARNDIVGLFFLLAAVAIALNAWRSSDALPPGLTTGALIVVGLTAGLAAGTKLNFLLPAAVLVTGLAVVAQKGDRRRALATGGLAALAGGGYWYMRNLIHAGNPLPWFDHIGPISLPAPDQALGGREAHSVLGYLTDGSIWSDWFLPGLHHGLGLVWPLLGGLALAGLLLCWGRRASPPLRIAGLTGLAVVLAWSIAPTSASGPEGMPHGFESGLRYLAPALVLGLALLPVLPRVVSEWGGLAEPEGCGALGLTSGSEPIPVAEQRVGPPRPPHSGDRTHGPLRLHRSAHIAAAALALLVVVAIGYPVQRHYLQERYADPAFTTPGLNATFGWARDISGAHIATTSTRQYPLFGTDLSNRVDFVGIERPHGGFEAPSTCHQWRRLLNAGYYDYVVASRDRIEPDKPPYSQSTAWTAGPGATVVLRIPPTVVFQLKAPLDPSACR
jgi:hypothetical protein